jgi:hypothetical protein
MKVDLEFIHFNHDPTSATTGAFSIRRNETIPVVRPEWRKAASFTADDAPAAYSYTAVRNLIVTQQMRVKIKAQFSCSDAATTKVWVRAEDGPRCPNNVLGTVAATEVTFVQGRADVDLYLDNVQIPDLGVDVSDVIWKWQYSFDGANWNDITTSRHRIYTVVDMPAPPWQPASQDINNTQLPWTEVLEFACSVAASEKDVDPAATKITLWANSLGPVFVEYDDPGGGWTGYTYEGPPRFHCSDFLLLLNSGTSPTGPTVNCDDCAAIVTSFSNILGCRLSEGKMGGIENFRLNPNKKIGTTAVPNGLFSYHTVAWLGDATATDRLFDACVQLDPDGDPTNVPHPFNVPKNILFTDYRPQLTLDAGNCRPIGKQEVRKIGLSAQRLLPDGLVMWPVLLAAAETQNLKFIDLRFIATTFAEIFLQSFWQSRTDPNVSCGIDTFAVGPGNSTAPLVENLLGRFHLRPTRMTDSGFAEEAYASTGRFTIVFAQDEFVFLVRNTGRKTVSTEELARFIDELLRKRNTKPSRRNYNATQV